MKNITLGILLATLALLACNKDTGFPVETYPPLVDPPPLFVPIYEPGDTSKGAAYADKLTKKWSGDTYCQKSYTNPTKLEITFSTYAPDGSRREGFGFGTFSSSDAQSYIPVRRNGNLAPLDHQIISGYSTWVSDGDVLEDIYYVDTTDNKNFFLIERIDLAAKRVEGSFHVTYQIKEPRLNAANPKTVTFSSGWFWATIRD